MEIYLATVNCIADKWGKRLDLPILFLPTRPYFLPNAKESEELTKITRPGIEISKDSIFISVTFPLLSKDSNLSY